MSITTDTETTQEGKTCGTLLSTDFSREKARSKWNPVKHRLINMACAPPPPPPPHNNNNRPPCNPFSICKPPDEEFKQMQQNKMKFNRVYVKRHPLDCKCEQKQPPRVPWLRAVASRPQPQLKDKRDKICECPPNVPSGLTWRKRERIREEAIERQRPIYRCL